MNELQTKSLAELLKEELMERYGLRDDQIDLGLTIHTDNQVLGEQILSDFSITGSTYSLEGKVCDVAYGKHISATWVHSKDGRFGRYEGDTDEE